MATREQVQFATPIVINDDAPLFPGYRAVVAYIGEAGVSVYLRDSTFDECVPLNWDEFEVDTSNEKIEAVKR